MEEHRNLNSNVGPSSRDIRFADPRDKSAGIIPGSRSGRSRCPACRSVVPEGARSCPVCKQGMYRTCSCGWQLPSDADTCPNCATEWSNSARTARKSRSSKAQVREALHYAGIGALIAVVAVFLVYLLISALAALAVDTAGGMPVAVGERLLLAWMGLRRLLGQAGSFFVHHGSTIALVVGIMAIGAGAGVAAYMLQRENRGKHSTHSARRVRRKRRK